MDKLLLLDKDGTLVRPPSGKEFVQHPEDQELIPGIAETIERFRADGWQMKIISNQGGVVLGYKTLEDAIQEMEFCLELLPAIDAAYFCPDRGETCFSVSSGIGIPTKYSGTFAENRCFGGLYRKPSPGMLEQAIDDAGIGGFIGWPEEVLFVGDRPEDEAAAKAAKVQFAWAKDFFRKSSEG
jgi:D-glycero-D-manno-heptose 1,7-bisphosphate phosphatase